MIGRFLRLVCPDCGHKEEEEDTSRILRRELAHLAKDIPQVDGVRVAPGEEVDEVWIMYHGELDYETLRQISDAVADVQLEFDFVTQTHIVHSQEVE